MENSNEIKSNPKHNGLLLVMLGLCFFIMGLIFFCVNCAEHANYNKLREGGKYTYGTVTEITTSNSEDSGIKYTAEGIYTVDQQDYDFWFKSDYRTYEGARIKVLYEEDNPSNYALEKNFVPTYVLSVIFMFIGGLAVLLIYGGGVRRSNLTDAEIYRMQIEREKRAKMIAEMDADDIWNYDITKPERNKEPYKKENPYMDERIYKGKTIQTKSNSAKIHLGTTAFYNKDKKE